MVHLNPDGKRSLGSGIAFTFVASVAVGLRLLTKVYTKATWLPDDSWAVLSLVALLAWMGVEFWGIFAGGGGVNIEVIVIEQQFGTLQNYIKSLYVLDAIYALTVTATKLSILYLYRRIFSVQRFRQISFAVAAVCVLWWLIFTIIAMNPCRPVKKFWQPQIEGHCYNFDEFFLGAAVADVVLDAVILALPIKMILGLQMSYRRKFMLCFVFLVGGFVIITGVVRTALVYVPHSTNINFTQGELWTNIHLGTAILCASLPTYPPLFSHLATFSSSVFSQFRSLFGTLRPSKATPSPASSAYSGHKQYDQLDDPTGEGKPLREAAARQGESRSPEAAWEMGRIVVKSTVDIV